MEDKLIFERFRLGKEILKFKLEIWMFDKLMGIGMLKDFLCETFSELEESSS